MGGGTDDLIVVSTPFQDGARPTALGLEVRGETQRAAGKEDSELLQWGESHFSIMQGKRNSENKNSRQANVRAVPPFLIGSSQCVPSGQRIRCDYNKSNPVHLRIQPPLQGPARLVWNNYKGTIGTPVVLGHHPGLTLESNAADGQIFEAVPTSRIV